MGEPGAQTIVVKLKPVTGSQFSVEFAPSGTVGGLKEEVCKTYDAPGGPTSLRLIYKGQILKDGSTLGSYGIAHDHVVHLVKSKAPAAGATPPAAGISADQLSSMGRRADPLVAHLERMGVSGAAAEAQAEQMRQVLGSAPVQQMLGNPDTLRQMAESDPMLRAMLRETPELQELFNDPEEMQRLTRIMANPSLSREMLRGIDLQLNQAEAHGLSAQLSSASAQVNRTLERAADEAAEEADRQRQAAAAAANPFAALFGGSGAAGGAGGDAPVLPWAAPPGGGAAAAAPAMPGGLGGGAFPRPTPEMRDLMIQMMDNPGTRELMRAQARAMMPTLLQSNPAMGDQLRMMGMGDAGDPAALDRFADMVTDPNMMRMMAALEGAGGGGVGGAGGAGMDVNALAGLLGGLGPGAEVPGAGVPGAGAGGADALAEAMRSLMGGGGGLGAAAPPPPADPEVAYADQLQQLHDMGFWDREANLRVLVTTQGNVNAAVERLLAMP